MLYSIIHDITDKRLAEEKLARSESFLNSIVDFSPNSLWISDEHGTLIRMNNACHDLLQIQDDEVVGKYNILNDNLMEDQGFMQEVINVFEKSEKTSFQADRKDCSQNSASIGQIFVYLRLTYPSTHYTLTQ